MSAEYSFNPIKEEIIYFHNISTEKNVDIKFPYHRHDAYEIYLFLSGNTNMYLEHTCYQLKRGDLIIINPEELHRSVTLDDTPYERIGINIKKTALKRLSSQRTNLLKCFESHPLGENNLTHLNDEQLNYILTLNSYLSDALHSDAYGHDILFDTYLAQLLVFINTLYHTTSINSNSIMPNLVRDTMLYVKNHVTEDITLEDLSNRFNYHGTYISYLFKQHTGLTLRSYIIDQKIALAKRLLSEGKSVSMACEISGFNDYSNFIRTFTKMVGISPGKYK